MLGFDARTYNSGAQQPLLWKAGVYLLSVKAAFRQKARLEKAVMDVTKQPYTSLLTKSCCYGWQPQPQTGTCLVGYICRSKSISNHEDPLAKRWVVMPKIKNLANHFKSSHSNHSDLLSINLANLLWMAKFVEPLQVCKKSVGRLHIIYYHIELIYSILTI